MLLVERKYNKALAHMSWRARTERTVSLFNSICDMLTLQVEREFLNFSPRELRKKVAERLYGSDQGALELLKRAGGT